MPYIIGFIVGAGVAFAGFFGGIVAYHRYFATEAWSPEEDTFPVKGRRKTLDYSDGLPDDVDE